MFGLVIVGCAGDGGKSTGTESDCANAVDDDGDGKIDCDDSDCSGAPMCGASTIVVECSHPGAGAPVDASCECTNTHVDVTGSFLERYRCAEGMNCEIPSDPITITIAAVNFDFTNLQADDMDSDWFVGGRYCGNIFQWAGGSVSGGYTETGAWTFTSTDTFTKVSDYTYVAGGGGTCLGNGERAPTDPGEANLDTLCP
jgi:hypothetical protein